MRITLSILVVALAFSLFVSTAFAQADVESTDEPDSLYFNLFDDVQAGPGFATYMGSMDGNPENKPLHFAARVNPSAFVRATRNVGHGVAVGAGISYERISGSRTNRGDVFSFSNNLISLDGVASYEFGFIPHGYLKIFGGGGPTLLLNPQYDFDAVKAQEPSEAFGELRELPTRVVFSVTGGVILMNQLYIGYRMPFSVYVDGWEGHTGGDTITRYDQLMYVQFGFTLRQLRDALDTLFRL